MRGESFHHSGRSRDMDTAVLSESKLRSDTHLTEVAKSVESMARECVIVLFTPGEETEPFTERQAHWPVILELSAVTCIYQPTVTDCRMETHVEKRALRLA